MESDGVGSSSNLLNNAILIRALKKISLRGRSSPVFFV